MFKNPGRAIKVFPVIYSHFFFSFLDQDNRFLFHGVEQVKSLLKTMHLCIYENRDNIKNPIDFAFRLCGCFLMKSGICFYEQLSVLILLGGGFCRCNHPYHADPSIVLISFTKIQISSNQIQGATLPIFLRSVGHIELPSKPTRHLCPLKNSELITQEKSN